MILKSLYRALPTLFVLDVTLFAQGNEFTAPAMASAWEQIALPEQRRLVVNRLLRAPGNPEVLYAMGSQGMWRSVDGGGSWERLGVMRSGEDFGLERQSISWGWNFYLADAVDPFLLYTINWNGYPARSRDGGMSWQTLEEAVHLLAADPERSGRLYGTTPRYGRLLISEDRGDTWSPTPVDTASFVLVNPAYPQYLYSGSQSHSGPLWRSADGGRTWAKSRWTHSSFWDLVADPRSPLGLYATSQDTLWHSEDGGDTWQPLWTRRTNYRNIPKLTVHPADPQQLLLKDESTVSIWKSRDAGQTWEEVVVPSTVYSLVLDPRDPDQYHAVVDPPVSLLHSADAGSHWEEVALPETGPPIGTVVFDRRGQLYAGASRFPTAGIEDHVVPGFFIRPGDGQEWVWQGGEVGRGMYSEPPAIDLLYVDAQQPQIVIAALGGSYMRKANRIFGWGSGSYLRSTDGGRSWKNLHFEGCCGSSPAVVADPRQAGVYYLTPWQGVSRSADYGETWEDRSAGLPSSVTGVALDTHAEEAVLYASTYSASLWRSTDEGLHWEYAGRLGEGENIVGLAINPLAADKLYAMTYHGAVYVSTDQGQGWTLLLPGSEWASGWSFERRKRLSFDPGDPERFFVVTGPQLLETRDGGQHWRSLGEDLASVPWFNDVAVDPLAPHLLYAATPWGLFRLDTSNEITAVEEAGAVPQHFALYPNYPNPFNPSTTIRFSLPQAGEAELGIYNLIGQRVAVLVQGMQEAGPHVLQWNGRDGQGRELASGVYLCRLWAGAQVEMRRLLLLR